MMYLSCFVSKTIQNLIALIMRVQITYFYSDTGITWKDVFAQISVHTYVNFCDKTSQMYIQMTG